MGHYPRLSRSALTEKRDPSLHPYWRHLFYSEADCKDNVCTEFEHLAKSPGNLPSCNMEKSSGKSERLAGVEGSAARDCRPLFFS